MKSYYRVMAGRASVHAAECFSGGYIGADFDIREDLSGKLPEEWRDFNKVFIPVFQANRPGKSKISAGLACGALWTVAKGIKTADVVLTPDGTGAYMVGEVLGDYEYAPGEALPHRRRVRWSDTRIARADMSEALRHATGSIGTVCNITGYEDEIRGLLGAETAPEVIAINSEIEDPLQFAMEKHLEEFLVANWAQTMLATDWSIYEEDGEQIGQQYTTDAGIIDILAQSKDGRRLLVVELKRGRATDIVVGQVLRYMGYIRDQVAEKGQTVEGVVIALEDDQKLRWALSSVPSVRFLRYEVSFRLYEASPTDR